MATLQWTPLTVARGLARLYTTLLDNAAPKLRRVGRRNLELAFPEKSPPEREEILNGVFRSIARVLLAIARFPEINAANVREWIDYEGFEHFEEGIKRGRGVLFATAHLGNWELSAFAHALMTAPMHVVVRPLDNPLIDAFVEKRRSHSGNWIIGKKDLARGILKGLRNNQAVGILMDQNTGLHEGVFVDFFGRKACAHAGFARLAARSQTTVLPGFALWDENRKRHVLKFYPPVEMTGDVAEDSQRVHSKLEEVIREYPDQWLWIHRRWKTRPDGEPSLY